MTARPEETVEVDELRRLLLEVHLDRERELEEWDRSLPFADGLFDRWERARRLGFGPGSSIYDSASVFGDVQVGAESWIGPYVLLDGSGGGLSIGHHCSISAGVQIYTHDTVHWALSGGVAPRREGEVSIGDCTHVGGQAIVSAGVAIGSHCVVGANSFVNRSVEDRAIVVGSPARVIGRVEGDGLDVRLTYLDG